MATGYGREESGQECGRIFAPFKLLHAQVILGEGSERNHQGRQSIVIILLSAGKDTCKGDSGSPLVVKKEDRYTLVIININIDMFNRTGIFY